MMKRSMFGISVVLFLACCPVYVRADQIAGSPAGPDPFTINFDGFGNATVSENGGPFTPESGFLGPDQSGTTGSNVLIYTLPETVGAGGVNIVDASSTIVANLFFYNTGSNGFMEYFLPTGTGTPASTGVTDFGGANVAVANADGMFSWQPGGNIYNGQISSLAVPEPNTLILMAVGLAGLVGYSRRLRKQVTTVC
jgi:hypothetical protein